MPSLRMHHLLCSITALLLALSVARPCFGADDENKGDEETVQSSTNNETTPESPPPAAKTKSPKKKEKRQYVTDNPNRSDAGVFHVGFAGGGNFYVEPQVDSTTGLANGQYFTDFGFQVGVYFDYDYSEVDTNIPLMLRGMVGYKYVLNSTNVFTFDGVAERVFRLSEYASFGLGLGASAAVWYRVGSDIAPASTMQVIFLPSMIVTAGFQFDPFMVDFKWLINRFGQNSTITGFELYFGFRL